MFFKRGLFAMITPIKLLIMLIILLLALIFVILTYQSPTKKPLYITAYIISGLTMITYPAVVSASITIFSDSEILITPITILPLIFFLIHLLQPITYIVCLILTKKRLSKGKSAFKISLIPFISPILLLILLII